MALESGPRLGLMGSLVRGKALLLLLVLPSILTSAALAMARGGPSSQVLRRATVVSGLERRFRLGQTVPGQRAALPVEIGRRVVEQRPKAWIFEQPFEQGEPDGRACRGSQDPGLRLAVAPEHIVAVAVKLAFLLQSFSQAEASPVDSDFRGRQ